MFVMEENYPVSSLMFKIDIENTRTRCEICSKLIIKTPKLFDFDFRLLTLNMYLFGRWLPYFSLPG